MQGFQGGGWGFSAVCQALGDTVSGLGGGRWRQKVQHHAQCEEAWGVLHPTSGHVGSDRAGGEG